MEKENTKPKKIIHFGIFLVLAGLILNEYLLTAAFSPDGEIMKSSKVLIWVVDFVLISLGFLILFSVTIRVFFQELLLSIIISMRDARSDLWNGPNNILSATVSAFVFCLLIFQFTYMVSGLQKNRDIHGIILATDLDAASCIAAAVDARWYNFHNTYGYGVLSFRLANSIENFILNSTSVDQNEIEKREERIHFSLTLISLISLFGMSAIIAHFIANDLKFKLLSMLLLNSAFFNTYMWVNYIFRVHPDLLLSFFASLFLVFLYKYKYQKREVYLYLAAFVGAAGLSSKLSFILFLPGLVLLEIPPFRKERILRLINLYFIIIVSYFIIGFPQNFRIDQNVSFMLTASDWHHPPTWDSFNKWWLLLFGQSWIPLLMIIILYLFYSKNKVNDEKRNKYLFVRLWAVAFFPFIFLLIRNVVSSHGHYILPSVSILLTATAISLPSMRFIWIVRLRKWLSMSSIQNVSLICLIGIVELTIGIIPDNIENVLRGVTQGREAARQSYRVVNQHADSGKKILVEAYTPFDHNHPNIRYYGLLSISLKRFQEFNPDIIVLNGNHLSRIMEGDKPNEYLIVGRENFQDLRDFYSIFYKKTYATDSLGQEWRITYTDGNQVQIWVKSNSL